MLARQTDFTTDNAAQLREELRLFYQEIVAEVRALGNPSPRWSVVILGEAQTYAARPFDDIAATTGTIRPPKDPVFGDRFRVCKVVSGSGSVAILPDDGSTIQGATSETIGAGTSGWREYAWYGTAYGWWRQA